MKKWDEIIIFFLVVISILPIILLFKNNLINEKKEVIISFNGEIHSRVSLNEVQNEEILIESKYHKNLLYISEEKVIMKEANCRDKICVKQGDISEVGESIVCLPNKIFIEIKGINEPDIILTH